MIKLQHKTWILISGLLWFSIGIFLLTLGLRLIVNGSGFGSLPLFNFLIPYLGSVENAAVLLITVSLAIGHFKGKYVLRKTAYRVVKKIRSLPNPAPITSVYGLPYLILIAVMVLLGVSIRYFGVPDDIRGIVDIAVGGALLQGAMRYFRSLGETEEAAKF